MRPRRRGNESQARLGPTDGGRHPDRRGATYHRRGPRVHGHLRHPPGNERAVDPPRGGVYRPAGLHLLQPGSAHPGGGHPRGGCLQDTAQGDGGQPGGRVGSGHEHGPRRRPQPGSPRGPAREPRALPDLLQGQGLEPDLRAPGQCRGAAGRAPAPVASAAPVPEAQPAAHTPEPRLRLRSAEPPALEAEAPPPVAPAPERRSRRPRRPRRRPAPRSVRAEGHEDRRGDPGDRSRRAGRHGEGRRPPQVPGLLPGQPRPPGGGLRRRSGPRPGPEHRGQLAARQEGAPRAVQRRVAASRPAGPRSLRPRRLSDRRGLRRGQDRLRRGARPRRPSRSPHFGRRGRARGCTFGHAS